MFHAIADGFNYLYRLLVDLFQFVLNGILWLLQPLFDLIGIIFEFIYWIGVIVVKIVVLVFTVGKMLIGLIAGLFSTIIGLNFSGRTASLPDSYASVYTHIRPYLVTLQLDKVAYILQFTIWIFTAFMAIKIIGSMRGGGGSGE